MSQTLNLIMYILTRQDTCTTTSVTECVAPCSSCSPTARLSGKRAPLPDVSEACSPSNVRGQIVLR